MTARPINPATVARARLDELLRDGKQQLANSLVDASILSGEQTNKALEKLYGDPSTSLVFPYPPVHDIVGRVAPGRLVFVMANTGQGKTTFMLDLLDRWAEKGVKVDYLGTEQEPDELRTKWACLRSDVPAGCAINLAWADYDEGESWRERVAEDLGRIDDAYGEQIVFHPDKFITLAKIEQAAKDSSARGGQVLIVDHIDRVETGASENEYLALKRIIRRLKELARDHRLVLVVASQVNRKGREGDRLSVYRPPQLQHMQGGATKEHEADVVLGIWRPIRQRKNDETPDDFKSLLAAASRGDVEQLLVVEPATMALVCLKHRTDSHEGMRCKLNVRHGRLSVIPERDQYTTGDYYPRKVS